MRFIILILLCILTGCSTKSESIDTQGKTYKFSGAFDDDTGVVDMTNKTCILQLDINNKKDDIPRMGMNIPIYVSKSNKEGYFLNELLDIMTGYDKMGTAFKILVNEYDDIIIVNESFDETNLQNIAGIFVSSLGKVFFITNGSEGIIAKYGLQRSAEDMKLYVTYTVKDYFINDVWGTYIKLNREKNGRINIENWYSELYRPGEEFSGVPISVTEKLSNLYKENGYTPELPFLNEPVEVIPTRAF